MNGVDGSIVRSAVLRLLPVGIHVPCLLRFRQMNHFGRLLMVLMTCMLCLESRSESRGSHFLILCLSRKCVAFITRLRTNGCADYSRFTSLSVLFGYMPLKVQMV